MDRACRTQGFVVRRYQATCSLALTAVLLGTCLVTDLLARNRDLERWLTARDSALAEKTGSLFLYTGNFIDFEERLMLDELPQADYSRGGVYFFGTSNMKWAFQTWDLPAEQRRSIGNYGIGASNHTTQLQFIRYLVTYRRFLTAGPNDLVVIGASFHLGHRDDLSTSFFGSMLRRQGLYKITKDDQIVPAPISALERWLRTEKARSGGFIWHLGRLAKSWAVTFLGRRDRLPHNQAKYRQAWRNFMGPRWRQNVDAEVDRFRDTVLFLRSRGAKVKVILLPQGTWMDELPFKAYYEAKIRAECRATETPLQDLSRAIADEDFVDSNHLTVEGQRKFRNLIMDEILDHLRKINLAKFKLIVSSSKV